MSAPVTGGICFCQLQFRAALIFLSSSLLLDSSLVIRWLKSSAKVFDSQTAFSIQL